MERILAEKAAMVLNQIAPGKSGSPWEVQPTRREADFPISYVVRKNSATNPGNGVVYEALPERILTLVEQLPDSVEIKLSGEPSNGPVSNHWAGETQRPRQKPRRGPGRYSGRTFGLND